MAPGWWLGLLTFLRVNFVVATCQQRHIVDSAYQINHSFSSDYEKKALRDVSGARDPKSASARRFAPKAIGPDVLILEPEQSLVPRIRNLELKERRWIRLPRDLVVGGIEEHSPGGYLLQHQLSLVCRKPRGRSQIQQRRPGVRLGVHVRGEVGRATPIELRVDWESLRPTVPTSSRATLSSSGTGQLGLSDSPTAPASKPAMRSSGWRRRSGTGFDCTQPNLHISDVLTKLLYQINEHFRLARLLRDRIRVALGVVSRRGWGEVGCFIVPDIVQRSGTLYRMHRAATKESEPRPRDRVGWFLVARSGLWAVGGGGYLCKKKKTQPQSPMHKERSHGSPRGAKHNIIRTPGIPSGQEKSSQGRQGLPRGDVPMSTMKLCSALKHYAPSCGFPDVPASFARILRPLAPLRTAADAGYLLLGFKVATALVLPAHDARAIDAHEWVFTAGLGSSWKERNGFKRRIMDETNRSERKRTSREALNIAQQAESLIEGTRWIWHGKDAEGENKGRARDEGKGGKATYFVRTNLPHHTFKSRGSEVSVRRFGRRKWTKVARKDQLEPF
ncbi:hypothetical protein B0H14DRAFT_2640492 [Mycena olivaceomarginata]|nr:hypothetical protein B0H14DRAFT_2640492 [Mycena olivaceomarginata]